MSTEAYDYLASRFKEAIDILEDPNRDFGSQTHPRISDSVISELLSLNQQSFVKDICSHFYKKCKKDLGFYGNDAPSQLIDYVMKNIKERENKVDAFIINGDFVEHGVA